MQVRSFESQHRDSPYELKEAIDYAHLMQNIQQNMVDHATKSNYMISKNLNQTWLSFYLNNDISQK